MSSAGANLGGEFRYLEPTYQGEINADVMPSDRLRDRERWGITAKHQGVIDSSIGGLGLNLNLNRVSDDNYWRDFGRASERAAPAPAAQRRHAELGLGRFLGPGAHPEVANPAGCHLAHRPAV